MAIDILSSNFEKHTSKNPLQKILIENFYKNLIELSQPLKPFSILDAGCGEGITLNKLINNGIGEKLEGVEPLKLAIKLSKKVNPNLKIIQGDIYSLPYKKNSFDLVICTEVLEHLTNPEDALDELKRVSKKYLLISVPNEPYFTFQRIIRGKNLLHFGAHPEHIQHWTSGGFKKFLKKNRLKIKKVRRPFAWTMILLEK